MAADLVVPDTYTGGKKQVTKDLKVCSLYSETHEKKVALPKTLKFAAD